MKNSNKRFSHLTLAMLSLAASGFCLDAQADVIYDSLPVIVNGPTSTGPSYGYEANGISEIGDHVSFAGTSRNLQSVTVQMNDYAIASVYGSNASSFAQALTLNLYSYTGPTAGALLQTLTTIADVPFRPAGDPTCPSSSGQLDYRDSGGTCRTSVSFNVTFDFTGSSFVLPDDLVFGLAFNTQDYGAAPTGTSGPYNSLNYTTAGTPTVGTDATGSDGLFFRDTTSGGAFILETGNDPYGTVAARFVANATTAVPEPSSIALFGIAGAGLLLARRRRVR